MEAAMDLTDKIALVSGAGSGIGRATARALAEVGATVIVTDVNETGGQETVAQIGERARFVPLDVADRGACRAVAADVESEFGRLDVLANVAGWDIIQPFVDATDDFMDRVVEINLKGPINLTKALIPALTASGSGRIVNVASDAGRVGSTGETVYAGAKGGVIAFTKSLAREMVRHQIRVNCV
jgi:2-hydroxycyclohexanecarboxyl-CoA dehydrogenase